MKDLISMGEAYNNMPEYGRSYIHWKKMNKTIPGI